MLTATAWTIFVFGFPGSDESQKPKSVLHRYVSEYNTASVFWFSISHNFLQRGLFKKMLPSESHVGDLSSDVNTVVLEKNRLETYRTWSMSVQ